MTTTLDHNIKAVLYTIELLEDELITIEDNEQHKRKIQAQIAEQNELYKKLLNQETPNKTTPKPTQNTPKPNTPKRGWSKYSRYRKH